MATQLEQLNLQLQILQNQAAGIPLRAQAAANQFANQLEQTNTQIANLQKQIAKLANASAGGTNVSSPVSTPK